jgi:hypothetical protein
MGVVANDYKTFQSGNVKGRGILEDVGFLRDDNIKMGYK